MTTRVCIAGGGPAGMMLGFLLARCGIDTIVLEKHADFLRDFRGDTVHPSTLDIVGELGLLDEFLTRPHQKVRELGAEIAGTRVMIADFSRLPTRCQFVALMPQWDFLDFLASHARSLPHFRLEMETEVLDLIERDGSIAGVHARTPNGTLTIEADLTVGADGRQSIVREKAGLPVDDLGAPIDVLWMRLPRRSEDPGQTFGYVVPGHVFVMLDRGDYWQCAFVIAKGGYAELRASGLESLHRTITAMVPWLVDRMGDLSDWDRDVKLLTVKVDRLRRWCRSGVLCIGDAAHAMSPIAGVGINLAVQDAVAAANLLVEPLRRGVPALRDLEAVQRRREFPTRATQTIQLAVQSRFLERTLAGGPVGVPLPLRMLNRWPLLRRLPARLVGVGIRPEHVRGCDPQRT